MTEGDVQSTEARILDVACRLFYQHGYHATTMRELAAEVGIKAASVYNHFSSKQAILVQICIGAVEEFYDGAVSRLQGIEDVRERLRALIVWHVWLDTTERYKARIADQQLDALEPPARQRVIAGRDAYDKLLQDELERGEAEGVWTLASPGIVRLAITAMCNGVNSWYREDGALTPAQIGEIYAQFVLNAICDRSLSIPASESL